ncbi:MAG TPA: hypothetical protein VGR49_05345 [Actinomycetota bacterium]|nr:hypothetical protein [Actinomycetota bacterium]
MRSFREFLKRTLPIPIVNWLRRWRGTMRYLRFLSYEVSRRQSRLETGSPLETLESRMAARRDGFYQQMVKEVVERTDLVLQQLDRKVEGQGARHAERLGDLEEEMSRLRMAIEELRAVLEAAPVSPAERQATHPARERAARRSAERRKLAASD